MSNFSSLISDILATVVGGVLLTLFFFLLREKLFKNLEIDGSWTFTVHTVKTTYNPYKDMKLTFLALLWREGNKVYGTAEKDYEDSEKYKGHFIGKGRSVIKLQGFIQKNYFSTDKLTIHMIENSSTRESSTIHKLEIEDISKMTGRFVSTISNQEGNVIWERRSS